QPANAGEASSEAAASAMIRTLPRMLPSHSARILIRRPAPGRPHIEPSRGLEPEVLAQAALWIRTIAGGAWSPAVAATGRTVGGLSEGRAGKQRDQRESSDKRFHGTSPFQRTIVSGFLQQRP